MSQTERFEAAFSDFLETKEYDEAEAALFALVRSAFLSGWQAAKQECVEGQNLIYFPGEHKSP